MDEARPEPGVVLLDQQLAGVTGTAQLVDRVREAGLSIDLQVEGEPVGLAPGIDISAYRILQEALTNTLKHAGPAQATVVIRYLKRELQLEVTDDGHASPRGENGYGLVGMRERVAIYGGRLETGFQPSGGFAVRAQLPLDTDAP